MPELFESQGVEDRTVYLAIRATDHGEPDVPLSTRSHEVFGAASRVGSDHDVASDQGWVVPYAVADGDLWWQLNDGIVEHRDVVGGGVGSSVARPKQP